MNTRSMRLFVPLTLGLLVACQTTEPPLPGTPVDSLADSGPGSLRAAIEAAAAGDTLRLTQTGTLTLQSPITTGKNLTILAQGVTVQAPTTGRALEVPAGATVTIKGGTLQGGTGAILPASLNRAELSAQFVRLSMDMPKLSAQGLRSQADPQPTAGGVILNQGTLTLDGVTVTGGRANLGGGIYNAAGATLTLTGTTNVTGNEATVLDPALSIDQGLGGGVFNRGSLTLSGGSVSGNTSRNSGAGIFGGTESVMTMSAGSVNDNRTTQPTVIANGRTTGAAGGGIFTLGDLTISGGSVSGNSTSYYGGGITLRAYLNAQNEMIRPNLTVSGGTFENNTVTDDAGGGSGGAIWSSGVLTILGGTVRGNSAPFGGGVTFAAAGAVTGGLFEGNRARTRHGGGILIFNLNSDTPPALTFGGTATVRGNTAAQEGGGIGVRTSALTMTGGTIENNTAVNSGGGIVFGSGSVSRIDGGTISGNSVTGTAGGQGRGGGVAVFGGSQLTLAGGTISGNTAAVSAGGLLVGGQVTMTGGNISGNTVTPGEVNEGGGGVRLYAGAKMTASGGTIQGNRARFGAGVHLDGAYQTSGASEFTLAGATVSGNTVIDTSNNGGGFWNNGKLTISSGNVTGNTATQHGGGVFNFTSAVYTQTGGTVSGNTPDNVFPAP